MIISAFEGTSMRKLFLLGIILLNAFFVAGFSPPVQSNNATITILNHKNEVTTTITDGDQIRIRVTLPQAVSAQEAIMFMLDNTALPAGSCLLTSGHTSCETDSFASLGWHWGPNGLAQNTRTVQAKTDKGDLLGQSDPIAVSPRPVVLVPGFLSNWQTWQSYLQPNGYLDSLGLKGFAVGDGQVPGSLDAGNPLHPTARTNTIAQNAEVLKQYISN